MATEAATIEQPAAEKSGPDITVGNHGSIFVFQPLTRAGREWIDENVSSEPWQWLGGGLCVEHRYASDLAQRALDDGLRVE